MKPVEVVQEELKVVLPVLPDDEGVITIPEPDLGAVVCCGDGVCSNSSMNMSARTGDIGDPMEVPAVCS